MVSALVADLEAAIASQMLDSTSTPVAVPVLPPVPCPPCVNGACSRGICICFFGWDGPSCSNQKQILVPESDGLEYNDIWPIIIPLIAFVVALSVGGVAGVCFIKHVRRRRRCRTASGAACVEPLQCETVHVPEDPEAVDEPDANTPATNDGGDQDAAELSAPPPLAGINEGWGRLPRDEDPLGPPPPHPLDTAVAAANAPTHTTARDGRRARTGGGRESRRRGGTDDSDSSTAARSGRRARTTRRAQTGALDAEDVGGAPGWRDGRRRGRAKWQRRDPDRRSSSGSSSSGRVLHAVRAAAVQGADPVDAAVAAAGVAARGGLAAAYAGAFGGYEAAYPYDPRVVAQAQGPGGAGAAQRPAGGGAAGRVDASWPHGGDSAECGEDAAHGHTARVQRGGRQRDADADVWAAHGDARDAAAWDGSRPHRNHSRGRDGRRRRHRGDPPAGDDVGAYVGPLLSAARFVGDGGGGTAWSQYAFGPTGLEALPVAGTYTRASKGGAKRGALSSRRAAESGVAGRGATRYSGDDEFGAAGVWDDDREDHHLRGDGDDRGATSGGGGVRVMTAARRMRGVLCDAETCDDVAAVTVWRYPIPE